MQQVHKAFAGRDRARHRRRARRRRGRACGPASSTELCGVAIDVGSTTIAGHLCDLATGEILASSGRMNPQIRFGEDLMSRVSYVMMNPGGERAADARSSARR